MQPVDDKNFCHGGKNCSRQHQLLGHCCKANERTSRFFLKYAKLKIETCYDHRHKIYFMEQVVGGTNSQYLGSLIEIKDNFKMTAVQVLTDVT